MKFPSLASVFVEIILIALLIKNGFAQRFATCSSNEICIAHKDCRAVQEIIARGPTREELNEMSRKQCDLQERMPFVCCQNEEISASRISSSLPEYPNCGGDPFADRIFGGEEANINDYPWHALLVFSKPNGNIGYDCGGSLISERFVITAAHCIKDTPETWQITHVRLGEWDLDTNPDCQILKTGPVCNPDPYLEVPVENIIVHPNYNPIDRNKVNDIALIKLKNDVISTKFISPICLPVEKSSRAIDYTNHTLEVSGFGRTENGTTSQRKMKLKLNARTPEYCQDVYEKHRVKFQNSHMCAGGIRGQDSCKGDSGGPLVKFQTYSNAEVAYYMLVGLVSFGPYPCALENYPGIYTRVSEHMDWIIQNTNY